MIEKGLLWQKFLSFLTKVFVMSITLDAVSSDAYDEVRDIDVKTPEPNSFEILDWIPIVSIVSGVARAVFGFLQAVVGVFAFPFQLIGRTSHVKKPFILIQGFANMVRGSIAVKPIVGNVILYIYDHTSIFKGDLRKSLGI